MKRLPPSVWLPAVIAAGILLWLSGNGLFDAWRVRAHEVAALPSPPHSFFAAGLLLFTLGAGAAFLQGLARGADGGFRGYRLLPILAFLALFVDLFVLVEAESAAPAARTSRAMQAFAEALHTSEGGLVRAPGELQAIAQRLGAPQYLVRGERLTSFRIALRPPCEGPVLERGDAGAGSLLVCFDESGSRAWITAVALPANVRFGAPSLFSVDEKVVVIEASARRGTKQATEHPPAATREESGG